MLATHSIQVEVGHGSVQASLRETHSPGGTLRCIDNQTQAYKLSPQMSRSIELVTETLRHQKKHLAVLEEYMKMVHQKGDWHGCMDASADIRECVARIEVLEWVLG